MKHIVFSFILVLLLTSCNATNLVMIDVRKPATVTFPPEVTNVLIVDNTPVDINDDTEKEDKSLIIKLDSVKAIFLKSLNRFMNEEKYFSKVETYPYRTNGSEVGDIVPLSERKIQSICNEKNADALISLDLFTVSGQLETEVTGYLGSYRMLGAKLGALVKVFSKEGKPYHKPIIQLDSLYREESVDWSRISNSIPPLNDLIVEISVVGADNLTGKFIPSWQRQERWYYSNKSSKMKEAEKLAKTDEWASAAAVWSDLYDKEKKSEKKIRLASNIALAYEYMDEIGNASNWIEKAYSLLPSKSKSDLALQITAYRAVLRERDNSIFLLYKQLGVDDLGEYDREETE